MIHAHRRLLRSFALALCFSCSLMGGAAAQPSPQPDGQGPDQVVQDENVPASGQLLSEEELAALAARDQKPADTVVGGALSNEHLTYIVIALAAAVIVLIAVH